jgi:hypothetical protein
MPVNMIGLPGQRYEARSTTFYTAGPNGYISNVANFDVMDLIENGCIPTGGGASLLGSFVGLNMNITTDQNLALTVPTGAYYFLKYVIGRNASISLTTAAGGIYTAASKGGTAVVAATQAYSTLTGSTLSFALTVVAAQLLVVQTANPLVFSLTTAQGAAATMDLLVYGDVIYQ